MREAGESPLIICPSLWRGVEPRQPVREVRKDVLAVDGFREKMVGLLHDMVLDVMGVYIIG